MTAIVIMIYSLGILTQSMNEINYAQQQIDQITCDQLKKGALWQAQSSEAATGTDPSGSTNYNIYERTYTVATAAKLSGSSWQNTVTCSYTPLN